MKKKLRIIGLCGVARSGKDTAALGLTIKGWTRLAFADSLKGDLLFLLTRGAKLGDIPREDSPTWTWFKDPAQKELLRPLMVAYGAGMRRLDPLYWVKRLEKTHLCCGKTGDFVITDVRYANEVDMIHSHGGIVVYIVRPGVTPANEEESRSLQEIKADFQVLNDGTAEELQAEVKVIQEAALK